MAHFSPLAIAHGRDRATRTATRAHSVVFDMKKGLRPPDGGEKVAAKPHNSLSNKPAVRPSLAYQKGLRPLT